MRLRERARQRTKHKEDDREKIVKLKHWHTADVAVLSNKARAGLDLISDNDYGRPEILIEMTKSPPTDSINRKLWGLLVGAILKFSVEDTAKLVDMTRVFGKCRTGTNCKRGPDLVLELKDKTNRIVCELGIGEGTSCAHKDYRKKNAKDLARIGLELKDAFDLIQDKYGVDGATLVGYQVIAQTTSIYLMRRFGNMYVMVLALNVFTQTT
ncbi:hypothetical protein BGZ95_011289 [Linnemannia exigua]|uniref:Uncharacterized protein n=1 Tax=Linnemannia exigua TaxID=604196 RepID=A0AAD4H5R4_9FUNG|nr:hypothetical protein BGZ95_011289 [Linnemannia exigua]